MDALGFLSKASTKFFHEVAPVALASVMGTVLVNHYSHSTAPASVVVQPPEAMVQTLGDEHQLIVDYLKRVEAEQAMSNEGSPGRLAAPATPTAKEQPTTTRLASAEKAPPRARPKVEKAQDPLPLGPDPASLPAPESPPVVVAGLINEGSNMASVIGGFAVTAWEYSGRALPKVSLLNIPASFVWTDGASGSRSGVAEWR